MILNGVSRDMFLADENGIIRQSSVPEFIGQSAADLDVFRDAAEHTNDKPALCLGGAAVNPIMRQWHLDAARTLHHPDGSFAGIIDADYRVSAMTDMIASAPPSGDGFAAVIGLSDGKLRATWGSGGGTPDGNIADTKMFGALDAGDSRPVGRSVRHRRHHSRARFPAYPEPRSGGDRRAEPTGSSGAGRGVALSGALFAGAITGLTTLVVIL